MALQCIPSTFTNLSLFGAKILAINTKIQEDWSIASAHPEWHDFESIEVKEATFCNVTVTYTHPGQGDNLKVEVWLPSPDKWNRKLMAVGGGGYGTKSHLFRLHFFPRQFSDFIIVAGGTWHPYLVKGMVVGLNEGFVVSTRDAGLGTSGSAAPWALLSEGNVNLYNLQNLASASLDDEPVFSKQIISAFYDAPLQYSYWNGCSQGGRQGAYSAQSNPTAYDGILAAAPAINWNGFFLGMFYPQLIMNLAKEYPHGCELDTLSAAAVKECDGLDGIVDGVISDEELCNFDPFPYVGRAFNCSTTGKIMEISEIAAKVAKAAWSGPKFANGQSMWDGLGYTADLSGNLVGNGPAKTICESNGPCVGSPVNLVALWISLFIERKPNFDLTSITHEQFGEMYTAAFQRYASMTETALPDLFKFKAAGGKMLTWHGIVSSHVPDK